MNWEDECYLLSKRKFRENANIINVFSNGVAFCALLNDGSVKIWGYDKGGG